MEAVNEAELLPLMCLAVWLQEEGTERRAKSQGINCRDDDRDRHRNPELTVERTTNSRDE